jgi:predicted nucleotidyltransferase
MIKFTKIPENILELLPDAAAYLEDHPKILFAYLFGSLARGKPLPLSDVDIAVYLADSRNVKEDKLDILGNLMDILQTDEIDMVVLNTAGLPLVMNILKNKKIIVDKDPFSRHTFESLIMRKYFDFSIKESSQLQRRYL